MKMTTTMLLPVFLLLGACSASNTASIETRNGAVETEYLKSANPTLAGRLAVVDPRTRMVGDLMQAQATLENRWKFQLDFQYKVKWFDADGFEIAPEGRPWTPVVIPGRNRYSVKATAPNPSATRFEIWVQE